MVRVLHAVIDHDGKLGPAVAPQCRMMSVLSESGG